MHCARTSVLAVALVAMAVSAFGQSGQSPIAMSAQAAAAQIAAQQQPPPSGPVRRLSIDDATTLALEQNLGIRIQRFEPQISDVSVWQAKSFWAPQFNTAFFKNSTDVPNASVLGGTASVITTGQFSAGTQLTEQLPWGGSYAANWNNQRVTTSDPSSIFNPKLQSNLALNYTQPIVRNRSIDIIRQQVKTSQKSRELSDVQLTQVITQTMRAVKNAYWDLSYAIANLKAQQQSLSLSQQSLRDNQRRVEIGTMAPIDIVQAQAEVASNEQGVIVADASIKTAQDQLRSLILDPGTPDFWTVSFEPTDAPAFTAEAIDLDSAVRNALQNRTDLLSAKNSLEQSDINIRYYRNQILPDVNAQLQYGAAGLGGTQFQRSLDSLTGNPTLVPVGSTGYGSTLSDVFRGAYPQWSVGVQIGYPLGASTSEANLARVRLQYEQAQTQLKNLEMLIATQVRVVARNVQTNQQRVRSAAASRELQERKLEAEEKKLAAGMSTSFFVFQAQRDLSAARVAEIQAVSDYNKSLVDFEAVQRVPVGGNFGGITTAGSGAIQTGNSAIIRQ